jgi:copper chaperone
MQYEFQVQGMTCGHCERAVTEAVRSIDPAAQVKVERSSGAVAVVSERPRELLAQAIREEGYGVTA